MYFTIVTKTNRQWHRLINVAGRIIYQDDHEPTAYNRICSETCNASLKIFLRIITLEMLSYAIAMIGPFYSYIKHGEHVTLYSVKWPFLSRNPNAEYIVNIAWETVGGIIAMFGFFFFEVMFLIVNNTIMVSAALSEWELDEFSNCLEQSELTEAQLRQKLLKIFMKISYIDE